MKRIFAFAVAVSALLSVSCKKEMTSVQGETMASFTIELPENILTKGYSDGTKATQLHYAVYDDNGDFVRGTTIPLHITVGVPKVVDIPVVKEYLYDIVFWAQSPDADCYEFNQMAKTITVKNYSGEANDDDRDAFYQVVKDYKYTNNTTTVELYRPFAQINILASDYVAVEDPMTSSAKFKGLPNVLNVLTGEATGSLDAAFTATSVPAAQGESLDYMFYSYVSMNYVLAHKQKANFQGDVAATFYYNGSSVNISVPNVPYQRNYRTNILVNKLFTGMANFTVEIVPTYGPRDNQEHEHWYTPAN